MRSPCRIGNAKRVACAKSASSAVSARSSGLPGAMASAFASACFASSPRPLPGQETGIGFAQPDEGLRRGAAAGRVGHAVLVKLFRPVDPAGRIGYQGAVIGGETGRTSPALPACSTCRARCRFRRCRSGPRPASRLSAAVRDRFRRSGSASRRLSGSGVRVSRRCPRTRRETRSICGSSFSSSAIGSALSNSPLVTSARSSSC